LLLTIQPADQSGEKKPEGEDVDHGGSLHQRPMRTPPPVGRVVGHYALQKPRWRATGQPDDRDGSLWWRGLIAARR
jgi:hypothetical protein